MKRLALVPVAAAILLILSCGGDSDKSSDGTAAPTTAVAGTDVSAPYRSAAPAVAKAAVLTLADLPSGWTGKPATQSASSINLQGECAVFNTNENLPGSIADSDSDDLTSPGLQQVSSGAAVFASAEAAKSGLDELNRLIDKCHDQLTNAFQELFKQGYVAGGGALSDLTDVKTSFVALSLPRLGDASNAYRITIISTVNATKIPAVIDVVFIRSGAMGAQMTNFIVGTIDDKEERDLAGIVASKLEQADASLPR